MRLKLIARWMERQVAEKGRVLQSDMAKWLAERFGRDCIYENENEHPAIEPRILEAFRRLTERDIVWAHEGLYWRLREDGDPPGRQVDF